MSTPPSRQRASDSKTRPPYAIQSVDNALRLAAILQLEGQLSVSEAAERLSVAPSTAHRLLSMLVYRDFAARKADRHYVAGPVLTANRPSARFPQALLRDVAMPHVEDAARALDETCNLEVRVGDQVRFIASSEGHQTLRISSREGMSFPLHRTSGGLQILAHMTPEELASLYSPTRPGDHSQWPDLQELEHELRAVRRTGIALNREKSEAGIAAIGLPIHSPTTGRVIAALACSIPITRFREGNVPRITAVLREHAAAVQLDLALVSATPPEGDPTSTPAEEV